MKKMNSVRIALGNLKFPSTPEQSVALVGEAIAKAAEEGVLIVCFPECYVPGYRGFGMEVQRPDAAFLERAWEAVAQAAAQARVAVILGTERIVDTGVVATALVVDPKGTVVGFQDKVQIDPSEEAIYAHGSGRQLFHVGPVTFGIVLCHEAWRYPETVRWRCNAVRKLVSPSLSHRRARGYVPSTFADPRNTFHEKAMLCRAAEKHVLFRFGELRKRRITEHVCCCATRRKLALLSAVRQRGPFDRRHRS